VSISKGGTSVQKGARKHATTAGELVDRKERCARACMLERVAAIAEAEEVARSQAEHAVENQKCREEYDFLVRDEPPTGWFFHAFTTFPTAMNAMIWSESTPAPLTTISPSQIMPQ
jgi:hypothetical protein